MTPSANDPAPREPFAAEPLTPDALSPRAGRPAGGCGKPAMIGCAVVVVLLGLAAVVFLLKARDLFVVLMARLEQQVVANLPEEVTDAERERLRRAFAAASEAVREGRADAVALQRMQSTLSESVLEGDGKLTREEVLELTETLEAVAGIGGAEAAPGAAGGEPPPSEALPEGGPPSAARIPPVVEAAPWVAA